MYKALTWINKLLYNENPDVLGAIQIICDTLGVGGYKIVSPNARRGREGVSQSVTRHFPQNFESFFAF